MCSIALEYYVFTLYIPLLSRAGRKPATPAIMAVRQHAVRAGKSIFVPRWTRPKADESIPVKSRVVGKTGKSIIQKLLRGHKMIFSIKQR